MTTESGYAKNPASMTTECGLWPHEQPLFGLFLFKN